MGIMTNLISTLCRSVVFIPSHRLDDKSCYMVDSVLGFVTDDGQISKLP